MKNIVHTVDPGAYLTISEVADVSISIRREKPEHPVEKIVICEGEG